MKEESQLKKGDEGRQVQGRFLTHLSLAVAFMGD